MMDDLVSWKQKEGDIIDVLDLEVFHVRTKIQKKIVLTETIDLDQSDFRQRLSLSTQSKICCFFFLRNISSEQ